MAERLWGRYFLSRGYIQRRGKNSESQDSDSPRRNGHLFPVEDMGQLLRAIYASEDSPG